MSLIHLFCKNYIRPPPIPAIYGIKTTLYSRGRNDMEVFMHNHKRIFRPIYILVCFVLFFASASAQRGEEVDSLLYFQLGNDTAFVNLTTSTGDTIAELQFSLKFDQGLLDTVTQIKFKIDFDRGSLALLDVIADSNWNGDDPDVQGDSIIFLDNGSVQSPASYTVFCDVRFLVVCQEELSTTDVEIVYNSSTTYVRLEKDGSGDNHYPPECNLIDGSVTSADYYNNFIFHQITYDSLFGQQIDVPVYIQNNFRLSYTRNFIL